LREGAMTRHAPLDGERHRNHLRQNRPMERLNRRVSHERHGSASQADASRDYDNYSRDP
jgi:hypothetical protein